MTRRLATAFEQRCRALLSPERPRRIVVGKGRQRCREFCGIGLKSLPTVAVEVEHHGSSAQDVLDAGQVFAGHGQHHVDKRSEEHTSELQSLAYLVCRLL